MMNYIRSFWQTEEEYKAACRSREILNQIFWKFDPCPKVSGLCTVSGCSGWTKHMDDPFFSSKKWYYQACAHRQQWGLKARKKDMVPRDIKRAKDRLTDWKAEYQNKRYAQAEQQALGQAIVLGEREEEERTKDQ